MFAAKFPSVLQRWLANIVAQIPKNNGVVTVFAAQEGDNVYPDVVDKYNLMEKVHYIKFSNSAILKVLYNNYLNPENTKRSLSGLLFSTKVTSKCKGKLNGVFIKLILAPFLAKGRVDIIHSHSETTGHKLLPIVKAQSKPFIISFHGLPPLGVGQLTNEMRKEYTDEASVILVNTEFAKSQCVSLGMDQDKIKILSQGTDTKRFTFKQKNYPSDGVIRILSVGRFSPEKGQEYSIQAIYELINSGVNISYTLIGEGWNKPKLLGMVEQLGLAKHIIFKSGVDEEGIIKEYQKAHIFIQPSLRSIDGAQEETQGVSIQEAQSCGAIVIASNVGGIPECIEDGVSAFLVEDSSVKAIYDKVNWLIKCPEKWEEWQLVSRDHVVDNFDIDVIGKKLMSIYREVIQTEVVK